MRHALGAFADDAKEAIKPTAVVAGGAIGGAVVAKVVVNFLKDVGVEKDDKGMPLPQKADGSKNEPTLPAWAPGIAPILVGLGVIAAGRKRYPVAAPAVAAGMLVVGVGSVLKVALSKGKDETDAKYAESWRAMALRYVPMNGLGEVDTYDSPLLAGLGEMSPYEMGVGRYFNGAVVTSQALQMNGLGAGAPVDIQMAGLGSAPTTASIVTNGLGNMASALYA